MSSTVLGPTAYRADPPPVEPVGTNWDLLEAIVSRWRALVALPVLGAALAFLISFVITPTYTSTTRFIADAPDRSSTLGSFANVASQLGVGLPASPSNSPAFYADVLNSNEIMGRVLQTRIRRPGGAAGDSIAVMELYAKKKGTPAEWMDRALTNLRKKSAVSVNPKTGIIELQASAPDPVAAQVIAERFVTALNQFNLSTRQSQAGQRRRFTGERLRDAEDSLGRLNDAVQYFLQTNRSFRDAPALQAQYDRLQRQVNVYQELFLTLRRDYETARINEVNDTPVITVVEHATVPLRRSAPSRALMAVLGAMLGAFFAVVWVLGRSFLDQLRARRPADYDRLMGVGRAFFSRGRARRARPA
jgi:uncharacterized protein involved in exopolysaccharide biosynthesis